MPAAVGVQCSCLKPLQPVMPKHAVFDGSLCALVSPVLDIFERSRSIDVFVKVLQEILTILFSLWAGA